MCRTEPIRPVSPCLPAFMSEALGVLMICRNGYVAPEPPPAPPRIPSMAIGVGNLREIASDDPGPGSLMVGTDVCSTDHERPAGVAEGFQRSEHGVRAPSSEISAVLKSEPTRADFSDKSACFEEEARALTFDTFAFGVGAGDVLARGASNDDGRKSAKIAEKSLCCKSADIIVNLHAWVVLGVEGAPPIDRFARCHGGEARAVHAEGPSTGSRAEKVENFDHYHSFKKRGHPHAALCAS